LFRLLRGSGRFLALVYRLIVRPVLLFLGLGKEQGFGCQILVDVRIQRLIRRQRLRGWTEPRRRWREAEVGLRGIAELMIGEPQIVSGGCPRRVWLRSGAEAVGVEKHVRRRLVEAVGLALAVD